MRSIQKMQWQQYPFSGFTLIEMMITVVVISILLSVAIPTYTQHVVRTKLSDATSGLLGLRHLTEQRYQKVHTYEEINNPGACEVITQKSWTKYKDKNQSVSRYFDFTCSNASSFTYIWTAINKANVGLGSQGSYKYSLDQNGNQKTIYFAGNYSNDDCWKLGKTSCI
jgi:type IV pilus assembly protein PilE